MSAPKPRLAFIGAGRLARVLAPALTDAGYPVLSVTGRGAKAARDADVVFLTVPDDAIAPLAAQVKAPALVHCSGALGLEVLPGRGGAFHPLQTFAQSASLRGVTIAVEASDEELLAQLEDMANALGGRPLRLPQEARPLYHASAALASNYVIGLLSCAARLWQAFGANEASALQALLPLVRTTIDNLERLGPEQALTGPVARGDVGTIERHLRALPPGASALYRQLALATLPLANLQPDQRAALTEILSNPKETLTCV